MNRLALVVVVGVILAALVDDAGVAALARSPLAMAATFAWLFVVACLAYVAVGNAAMTVRQKLGQAS